MAGRQRPSMEEMQQDIRQHHKREALRIVDEINGPPDQKELDRRARITEENVERRAQGLPPKRMAQWWSGHIGDIKPGKSHTMEQWKINGINQPPVWGEGGPPPPKPPPPKQEFPPRPPGLSPFHWEEMHRQRKKDLEMRQELRPDDPRLMNREGQRALRENMLRGAE